jgi:hypothetical protein
MCVSSSNPNSGGNNDGSFQEVYDQQVNLEEAREEIQPEGHRNRSSKAQDGADVPVQQLDSYQNLSAAGTNQIPASVRLFTPPKTEAAAA